MGALRHMSSPAIGASWPQAKHAEITAINRATEYGQFDELWTPSAGTSRSLHHIMLASHHACVTTFPYSFAAPSVGPWATQDGEHIKFPLLSEVAQRRRESSSLVSRACFNTRSSTSLVSVQSTTVSCSRSNSSVSARLPITCSASGLRVLRRRAFVVRRVFSAARNRRNQRDHVARGELALQTDEFIADGVADAAENAA